MKKNLKRLLKNYDFPAKKFISKWENIIVNEKSEDDIKKDLMTEVKRFKQFLYVSANFHRNPKMSKILVKLFDQNTEDDRTILETDFDNYKYT